MSIEKQSRRALRRVVFWRLVGDLFTVPQLVLAAIQSLVMGLGRWIQSMEMAVFYFELDAARRYKLLTGVDLGTGAHSPGRYAGVIHPDLAENSQRKFIEDRMADEDDE